MSIVEDQWIGGAIKQHAFAVDYPTNNGRHPEYDAISSVRGQWIHEYCQ